MPGVPKSTGCKLCKTWKKKCDLNWPTCSLCQRLGKPCSGPSSALKWVEADRPLLSCASQPTPRPAQRSSKSRQVSKNQPISTNHRIPDAANILARTLQRAPTTASDRQALQLVKYLETDPHKAVLLNVSYLPYLPQRLGEGAALRDCVALFCMGWGNFKRGVSTKDMSVQCSRAYGKAIRSIQKTLSSVKEQLKSETLAAVTLLERYEILFADGDGHVAKAHAKGLHAMMKLRGPPDLDDDLDIYLMIENQITLTSCWTLRRDDNFFLQPEWKQVLKEARRRAVQGDIRGKFEDAYRADTYFELLPALTREARNIFQEPVGEELKARAQSHHQELLRISDEIQSLSDPLIERAFDLQVITKNDEVTCPGGMAYEFAMIDFCELLSGLTHLELFIQQMTVNVEEILGICTDIHHGKIAKLSRQVCMMGPYLQSQGPIAAALYATPFYFAFKATKNVEEKEYIIHFMMWMDALRQRLPTIQTEMEASILRTVDTMTGRIFTHGAMSHKVRG